MYQAYTFLLFLTVLLLIKIIYDKIVEYMSSCYVKSNIDNVEYLVRNTENKQEIADTLAVINSRIDKLLAAVLQILNQ